MTAVHGHSETVIEPPWDRDDLISRLRWKKDGLLTAEEETQLLADLVAAVAWLKEAGLGLQDPLGMRVLERRLGRTVERYRKTTRQPWWRRCGKNGARWNPDTLRWEAS